MVEKKSKTVVGDIRPAVLEFTAGRDYKLDLALVEADCIGTAAHVNMLARLPVTPPLFEEEQRKAIIHELKEIIKSARENEFEITVEDQDIHLAVERVLTDKLGELGKKVHTARSRNDQVALDLRLFARGELLGAIEEASLLAQSLLEFAHVHQDVPMVGRTHLQPAMPSSVGLWASSFAESLLDDINNLRNAYRQNDCSPLGSAAGYGVPLSIDRELVADLLGFRKPCHNVLYAANSRGKLESVLLSAMSQAMLTLSRLAQDLIIFSMPEFGYFRLPDGYCTGSSIMPQKKNPDVLELIRARTARVKSNADCVYSIVQSAPSGYNRDLQEAKEPFLEGVAMTRQALRVLPGLIDELEVDTDALLRGFTPDVFATDRALELVGAGTPFRDAYYHVKENLDELEDSDPAEALAKKDHLGAPAGLDFQLLQSAADEALQFVRETKAALDRKVESLIRTDSGTQ